MTWDEAKQVVEDNGATAVRRAGWSEEVVRFFEGFELVIGNGAGYKSYEPTPEEAAATDWEECEIPTS